MNNNSSSLYYFSKPVDRADFISLLKTASSIAEYRFTRQAALAWLASFPGDLLVSLLLAESLAGEGKFSQAIPSLEKLVALDPEFEEANEVLSFARLSNLGKDEAAGKKTNPAPANPKRQVVKENPDWRLHDVASQKALSNNRFEEAEDLSQKAILANPDSPIPAIHQVKIAQAKKDYQTVHNLAELYHQRWPDCLQFSLYLAEAYLQIGDETKAVSLLHHCVARDSAGQVAHSLWGLDHPYETLWPEKMEINFDLPIPAAVSGMMGWNQLQAGSPVIGEAGASQNDGVQSAGSTGINQGGNSIPGQASSGSPSASSGAPSSEANQVSSSASGVSKNLDPLENLEDLQSIQTEFEKLAKRVQKSNVSQADGRYPIYVILSTRKGLEEQFGAQTAAVISDQIKSLAYEIRKRPGWGSLLFQPDDPVCTSALSLKPVLAGDPWKIKLSLNDLDRSLGKRGERIGAILIIGGPEVVPFHHLPNPTDDGDPEVASDNPYTTSDENYFIPEWPLGRIPCESGSDACLLLERLRKLTLDYAQQSRSHNNLFSQMGRFFKGAITHAVTLFKHRKLRFSVGYSAQVWREASAEVFKTIGQAKLLKTSPPLSAGCRIDSALPPSRLGYFNLHGIQDAVEWYGQKCLDDTSNSPDYPVALSPKDIQNNNAAPQIIFSEACYGAYLNGQKTSESIALTFLSSGARAFVGSTCVAYGSVTKPLIAADLLAKGFWEQLRDGQTVGNALRRSKINLAREMTSRQGYLDGEDQKTLLSFILYGDPLAVLEKKSSSAKVILRSRSHPVLKTVTDRRDETMSADQLPPIMMIQVKEMVNQYLPGLKDAEMALNLQSCTCKNETTQCHACKISAKGPAFRNQKRVVVTLSKEIPGHKGLHHVYARMTLDPNGKVLKISTSR